MCLLPAAFLRLHIQVEKCMRLLCQIPLICLAAAAATAADTIAVPMRPGVAEELSRAIDLEFQGQLKEAERIVLNVIRNAEAAGSNSMELGVALNNLAVLYIATNRYADAEQYFKQAQRVLESIQGELAQQVVAKSKIHLAAVYLETDRGDEAMKLDVPSLVDVLLVPEDKARAKGTIAGLAAWRKDLNSAERIYAEALSFWREPSRAAASQAEIATILNNMGAIALDQGRNDIARTWLEQSLIAWQTILGSQHPTLAKAMANIGAVSMRLKKYGDAAMWMGRAAELGRTAFGELHPFTISAQFGYADALKKAGRKSEASLVTRMASAARKMMRNPSTSGYVVSYRDLQANQR
jgi:Tfp pilus assembly protein PilF